MYLDELIAQAHTGNTVNNIITMPQLTTSAAYCFIITSSKKELDAVAEARTGKDNQ